MKLPYPPPLSYSVLSHLRDRPLSTIVSGSTELVGLNSSELRELIFSAFHSQSECIEVGSAVVELDADP